MKPRQTTPLPLVTVGVLGWSRSLPIFSAVLVISGLGGLAGGRLGDRLGTRPAFLIAGIIGAAGIAGASYLTSFLPFAGLYAIGCGVISALGFYHITQPAAVTLIAFLFAAIVSPSRALVVAGRQGERGGARRAVEVTRPGCGIR